jgi:signal transduction histidine kinase
LLIARIESRQYLREESFSVNELLHEIISEISPIAEDAGILLKEELYQDYQFVGANRSLIFSMFYNVVNNAVKNTPAAGEVIVRSSHAKNKFVITITDTGKGMTRAQMGTLFSRFKTRLDHNGDGTGIGLAISKSIADFHGIDISVESAFLKGTSFSFSFHENS